MGRSIGAGPSGARTEAGSGHCPVIDAAAFGARWAAFSRASVFPTLAAGLAGGVGDPRAAEFTRRREADMAARLAAAPQRVLIPLARLLLAKEAG
jgi:hypothetical protein